MRTWKLGWPAALAAGVLAGIAGSASGIDVEFTYQGYLEDNGVAIDGPSASDVVFRLFDDPANGALVDTVTKSAGSISFDQGVFSTPLAFATSVFDGEQLWLEVEVDGNTLSPRQKVTAAPYSLATRGITVESNGDIGVGLDSPIGPFHLRAGTSLNTEAYPGEFGSNLAMLIEHPDAILQLLSDNGGSTAAALLLSGTDASGSNSTEVLDTWSIRKRTAGSSGLSGRLEFSYGSKNRATGDPVGTGVMMTLQTDGDVTIGSSANGPAKLNIVGDNVDNTDLLAFDEDTDGNPTFRFSGDFGGAGENNELQLDSFLQDSIITVDAGGNVGINAGDPRTMLDVNANDRPLPANARGAAEFLYTTGLPFPGATPNTDQHTVDIRRTNGLNGAAALNVEADAARAARFSSDNDVDPTVEILNLQSNTALELISFASNGPMMEMTVAGPSISSTNFLVMRDSGGNRARINGSGRGFFNGGTQTGGADVAEWFAVEGDRSAYEPGDLLVISTESDRTVTRSTEAYSTLVTGVYATRPGVLLTERHVDADHSDMVPMGVIGVVPTKVSVENGPIRRGDLLVSSTLPGHAMKGTDRSRMLGAVVGKALEGFNGEGTGVIRVMVSPK